MLTKVAVAVTLWLLNSGLALHATQLALDGAVNPASTGLPATAESRPFGLDRSEANVAPMLDGFSTTSPVSEAAPAPVTPEGWVNSGAVQTLRLDEQQSPVPRLAVAEGLPLGVSNGPGVSNSMVYAGLGVLLLAMVWACSGQLNRRSVLPTFIRYERVSHRQARVRMLPLDMQG